MVKNKLQSMDEPKQALILNSDYIDLRESINLPDFAKVEKDECLLNDTMDASNLLADLSDDDIDPSTDIRDEHQICPSSILDKENQPKLIHQQTAKPKVRNAKSPGSLLRQPTNTKYMPRNSVGFTHRPICFATKRLTEIHKPR